MKYYLAVDIGASSGRHIVGWRTENGVETKEVYRFANGVEEKDGHLTWDTERLLREVKIGIAAARAEFGAIESLSIDTWGVDYVLLRGEEPVLPCYAYRDGRTTPAIEAVHALVPFEELYAHTGCQFQPFTTIYQLYADKMAGRLEGVTSFLMLPCYLMYRLTGVKACEYTEATTTGLLNAQTGDFDVALLDKLGLPKALFPKPQAPGTVIGSYDGIKVVLCATHDTGSAVEGIPMEGRQMYISSGTWSLLGVKTDKPITGEESRRANWSNEGGVGYNRYQKNIMGMWLINELRRELCPDTPFPEVVKMAEESAFEGIVDAEDSAFLSPESMRAAFDGALDPKPQSPGDYFRCAYRSLALGYEKAIRELEDNTGKTYDKLYIVGGGAKNAFLNCLTEEQAHKKVIALPIEATALGNLKVQMEVSQ